MNQTLISIGCCVLFLLAGSAQAGDTDGVRSVVRIVGQKYCYGDADVFTVWLKLDVEIVNSSGTSYYLPPDLVPYVGRVAESVGAAERGKYINEWTGTRYPTRPRSHNRPIQIRPGRSTVLHIDYGVPIRRRRDPAIPGTVPMGSYALQLVLRPEYTPSPLRSERDKGIWVTSLTTEPVSFQVAADSKPKQCK